MTTPRKMKPASHDKESNEWLYWVAWAVVVVVLVAVGLPWWAKLIIAVVFSIVGRAALKRWPTS